MHSLLDYLFEGLMGVFFRVDDDQKVRIWPGVVLLVLILAAVLGWGFFRQRLAQ